MSETAADMNTQIKQGIVRSLRLPMSWEEIGDDTPLFDGGLSLDSIDVLNSSWRSSGSSECPSPTSRRE